MEAEYSKPKTCIEEWRSFKTNLEDLQVSLLNVQKKEKQEEINEV